MPEFDPSPFDDEEMGNEDKSSSFRQLREYAKKLEKELKSLQKEAEELRQFRAEQEKAQRKSQLAASFKELGLSEKHAELFLLAKPDTEPNVEEVKRFALEYGLLRGDSKPEEENKSTGAFAPLPPSGEPAGSKRYTSEEFWALYQENPNEALRAASEGRVDFKTSLKEIK
jgi:hypothetical protein